MWHVRFALLVGSCLAVACSSGDDDDSVSVPDAGADATVDAGGDDGGDDTPPEACRPGTPWDPDTPAYEERTEAWGLSGLSSTGFGVGDVDEDGWADVVIVGSAERGTSHLFLNRPAPSGGGRAFVDATGSSFFATRDGAGGRVTSMVAFADVNDDGHLDAFSGFFRDLNLASTGDDSEIVLGDGTGEFALAAGPRIETWQDATTSGAQFLDYDHDGALDLFVGYWYEQPPFSGNFGDPPLLFHGLGDGRFDRLDDLGGVELGYSWEELQAGESARPLFGATACDVSGDGRADLALAAYGRQYNALLVSDGDGFLNQSLTSGVGGDEHQDFSDDQSYRCFCFDNPDQCPEDVPNPNPAWGCRGWLPGVTDTPGMLNGNTFSIACGDVDNDGDMDLYTGEISHPDVGSSSDVSELLLNETTSPDEVRFERPGREEMGLAPPVAGISDEGGQNSGMWDFDNDGWLDPYLGGSPYPDNFGWLFHQVSPLQFEWIGEDAGFYHPCPHGVALADFDHDGDQDLIVGTYAGDFPGPDCTDLLDGEQPVRFYENVASDNDWTSIHLVGAGKAAGGANRAAIGARVRVTAGGITRTAEVSGAWGRSALSRDLVVHLGLADACRIEHLEVRWPDAAGTTETFDDIPANYRLEIHQGEGRVRYLE